MSARTIDKPIKERVNIYSDPKLIDGLMKSHLDPKKSPWKPSDIELRSMVIFDYLRQGLSREMVAEQLEDRWGYPIKTTRGWVNQAIRDLVKLTKHATQEEIRSNLTEVVNAILSEAIEDKSKDVALKAVELIGKLTGTLSAKTEVNLTGSQTIKFEFDK